MPATPGNALVGQPPSTDTAMVRRRGPLLAARTVIEPTNGTVRSYGHERSADRRHFPVRRPGCRAHRPGPGDRRTVRIERSVPGRPRRQGRGTAVWRTHYKSRCHLRIVSGRASNRRPATSAAAAGATARPATPDRPTRTGPAVRRSGAATPLRVVHVGRRDEHRQRDTAPVTQHVDLRAGLATVDRVRPGFSAPFSARTLIESTISLDQSISPITPRRCSNCWCSRSHSPAVVHAVNRRCTVARLTAEQHPGQLRPRTAGLDHVHDRREHRPVVGPPLAAALRPRRRDRNQRLRHLPQLIRRPGPHHILWGAKSRSSPCEARLTGFAVVGRYLPDIRTASRGPKLAVGVADVALRSNGPTGGAWPPNGQAARRYSWINPPRTSTRSTRPTVGNVVTLASVAGAGTSRSRLRCGRAVL